MEISIKYDGYNYTVLLDNEPYFNGKVEKKFWKTIWTLRNNLNQGIIKYDIRSKYFSNTYKVIIDSMQNDDIKSLIVQHIGKKRHMIFSHDNADYLIVFHKGNNISFFKNDIQFALLKRKTITIGYNDAYRIIVDRKQDLKILLTLSYLIILLDYDYSDNQSDFAVELGRFQKELKPVNVYWSPT